MKKTPKKEKQPKFTCVKCGRRSDVVLKCPFCDVVETPSILQDILQEIVKIREIVEKYQVIPNRMLPAIGSTTDFVVPSTTVNNSIIVDFPSLTAKEIVESCNNTTDSGKLLYDTTWYKNEVFYTKEKTRPGKRQVRLELLHKSKTWDECAELLKKEGQEMLNFAETVYLLKTEPRFRELLEQYNWTWTCSRSSGGYLVLVGDGDSRGVSVGFDDPGYSSSCLGVVVSRSVDA